MSEPVKEIEVFKTSDASAKEKGVVAQTGDGFDNFVSRLGLNNNNTLSAGLYIFNLMTRNRIQLEAAYRGSWVVGQVIDCVAEDMTRAGINITTNKEEQDIKELQAGMNRLQIWSSICDLIKWGRLYGGAIGVIQIEGQDLETPLRLDTIAKGQFQGLVVFDRWQLNPNLAKIIQAGPNMGLPEYYDIVTTSTSSQPEAPSATGQIRVHHSRVIRNIGIKLPFFQAITEMMWGESVLERLWDRLIAYDSVTMSTANLVERANNRTVGVEGYREIIAAGGKAQQALEKQFEAMREFQTNEGMTVMDKNDTFATTNYTFAGLGDVILQFAQQLSGSSQIPLVRLLGQSPAGLNATGESDLRLYYDSINAKQEATLRPGVTTLLHVMWRSFFGTAAPEDLEFTFTPLWQMSALDKANIGKTNTETVLGALAEGAIDLPTAMKELRQSSGDTGLFSNISDEQIEQAELEPPPNAILPEGEGSEADLDPKDDVVKNLDAKFKGVLSWLKLKKK
jgi:phage-related protein (TIGR01555 family)